jgi:hypothetical protein
MQSVPAGAETVPVQDCDGEGVCGQRGGADGEAEREEIVPWRAGFVGELGGEGEPGEEEVRESGGEDAKVEVLLVDISKAETESGLGSNLHMALSPCCNIDSNLRS